MEGAQKAHPEKSGFESALDLFRFESLPLKTTVPDARPWWDYFIFRRSKGQIPELDGLRGLAIILVVLRHAVLPYWGEGQQVLPIFGFDAATFMANGWIGVDLFFVLSGFLISFHILKLRERINGAWNWRSYLARRVLRIVPAYYATLFLVALGAFPLYPFSQELIGLRIAYHLLFLQDYLPANFIVVFWSLGVEEKFYIIAPFIVLGITKLPKLTWRITSLLIFLVFGVGLRVWTTVQHPEITDYQQFFYVFRSPFHMTLDPILLGVLLAFLYQAREKVTWLQSRSLAHLVFWAGTGTFLVLSTTSGMMDVITWWDKTLQPLVIALSFFGMTYGLLFGGGPRAIFRTTTLFFFARVSYCLYLVHLALSPSAMSLAGKLTTGAPSLVVFFPVFLGVSVAASLLLHYGVEKPFLILKARIP